MNRTNPVFSHQFENALQLGRYFDKVDVLTGEAEEGLLQENISVRSYDWKPGHRIFCTIRFLRIFLITMVKLRPKIIFSHMTEVQSALIAPLCRLFRVKHYLWYAHAHKSIYLRWCHLWCDGIITSTPSSSPIKGKKIHYVGQSIDTDKFNRNIFRYEGVQKYVHVGRLDESKRIDVIVESFLSAITDPRVSLTFFGKSSTPHDVKYLLRIKEKFQEEINKGRVVFQGAISRESLPLELPRYGGFLHAFPGSLDKAILEATSIGIPVITLNSGFIQEFSSWGRADPNTTLEDEISAFLSMSPDSRGALMNYRVERVKSYHSIATWGVNVSNVLLGKTLM
jgi:glycosyltransferase involved in cell wall biosynthesis